MVYLNWTERYEDESDQLPDGLIAQLVEHCIAIWARSKKIVSIFRYFITSTWSEGAKLRWDFVKFGRLTDSKYFTQVGAPFSREINKTNFFAAARYINLQKPKYYLCKPYFFSCWKFLSRWKRWKVWKISRKKFKKPQIKPWKKQKAHLFVH